MKRSLITLLCAMLSFGVQASETAKATPKDVVAGLEAVGRPVEAGGI